jgi:hypothetical protein
MKKLLLCLAFFIVNDNLLEARGGGGGGFHGGGGGFHGGSSHMSGSHSGGSRSHSASSSGSHSSSASRNGSHSGNHNGNTYNHTNNFYGGHGYGYGGWGAWGAFGFTALATTGMVLAASSAGNGNNAQLQKTLAETQIEMEQLQQRLDTLEHQGDKTPHAPAHEQSPFNDPQAIKAYMEQLKKAQIDLKAAQAHQQKTSSKDDLSDNSAQNNTLEEQAEKPETTEKKIETLQDRLNSLKAQLYDYWYGTDNAAA